MTARLLRPATAEEKREAFAYQGANSTDDLTTYSWFVGYVPTSDLLRKMHTGHHMSKTDWGEWFADEVAEEVRGKEYMTDLSRDYTFAPFWEPGSKDEPIIVTYKGSALN